MFNKLRKIWCYYNHMWETTYAKYLSGPNEGKEVALYQTCDKCEKIRMTPDGILFFQNSEKGLKALAEAVYSVHIK